MNIPNIEWIWTGYNNEDIKTMEFDFVKVK